MEVLEFGSSQQMIWFGMGVAATLAVLRYVVRSRGPSWSPWSHRAPAIKGQHWPFSKRPPGPQHTGFSGEYRALRGEDEFGPRETPRETPDSKFHGRREKD